MSNELIAGSCAAKGYKPRQVREEAAVVTICVSQGCLAINFLSTENKEIPEKLEKEALSAN
jgi:hypothetical protein